MNDDTIARWLITTVGIGMAVWFALEVSARLLALP